MNNQSRRNRRNPYWSYKKKTKKYEEDNKVTPSEASKNSDSVPELPGFYYDHAKQKYFKIGSNSFGVTNAVTHYSLAKKREEEELSVKNKPFSRNIVNLLSMSEFTGSDAISKNDFKDYIIQTSKPRKLLNLSNLATYPKFKDLQTFQMGEDTFFLITFGLEDSINYSSCIFKVTTKELDTCHLNPSFIKFRNLNTNYNEFSRTYELYSSTKAYVQNSRYFVRTDVDNSRRLEVSTLEAGEASAAGHEYSLNNIDLAKATFPSTILCSVLNSDQFGQQTPTKYAVGLVKSAQVNTIGDTQKKNLVLDTRSSDVYCITFKPMESDSFVFAGCKNSYLYGYDLRINTRISEYEHSSCVGGIAVNPFSSNTLISSDFTGQIYLWDLRMNRLVAKYFDYRNKCSIKLSKCGNYLFSVSKEGNVNIWNLKTTELVKTIQSQAPSSRYEISYAEVPIIDLSVDSKMFYSINNEIYIYDF